MHKNRVENRGLNQRKAFVVLKSAGSDNQESILQHVQGSNLQKNGKQELLTIPMLCICTLRATGTTILSECFLPHHGIKKSIYLILSICSDLNLGLPGGCT